MRSVGGAVSAGVLLAIVGVAVALGVTPARGTTGKATVLATGDTWGEVEPCG